MTELVCAIASRLGGDYDPDNPPAVMVSLHTPTGKSSPLRASKAPEKSSEYFGACVKQASCRGESTLGVALDWTGRVRLKYRSNLLLFCQSDSCRVGSSDTPAGEYKTPHMPAWQCQPTCKHSCLEVIPAGVSPRCLWLYTCLA